MSQTQDTINESRKQKILSIALGEGIKYGVVTGILSGITTVGAMYRYKNFNRFMSTSAKFSLPIMTGVGMFGYKYEISMHDMMRFPENWGLTDESTSTSTERQLRYMPFHHRIINTLYDNPLTLVAALGAPLAGTIFYRQLHEEHLTLSQKIMHSRVYAQAGIITILLVTMMFREYMKKYGRYPDPNDE